MTLPSFSRSRRVFGQALAGTLSADELKPLNGAVFRVPDELSRPGRAILRGGPTTAWVFEALTDCRGAASPVQLASQLVERVGAS
jgi:hypothetical protein